MSAFEFLEPYRERIRTGVDQPSWMRGVQLRARLLPLIVIVLLLVQWLDPYRGWKVLLIGLGGVMATGFIWTWLLAGRVGVERDMHRGWAQVGDKFMERIAIRNRAPVPAPWLEIRDRSTLPQAAAGRVLRVAANEEKLWTRMHVCSRRGLFELGPMSLKVGDPFGIFTARKEQVESRSLLVTPPIIQLPRIDVAPGGRIGEGRPRPQTLSRRASAAGLREYVPGDSLRLIHWPSTAHHNTLVVRRQEGVTTQDWWILLDLNRRVQAGSGDQSTEELAIILAASLADKGLRKGKKVGLATFSPDMTWLAARSDPGHRARILRALAVAKPGHRSLADLLKLVKHSRAASASLLIITPDPNRTWIEALVPILRSGGVATVLLADPNSFGRAAELYPLRRSLARLRTSNYVFEKELLERTELGDLGQVPWEWFQGVGEGVN
ncbi:MAG: DUF58 domain-containing protein [Anaerolineales bacterium]|nr:DUF58 domain-containing protein [Anaerolineales bacterium]